jgi:hypothetical protein
MKSPVRDRVSTYAETPTGLERWKIQVRLIAGTLCLQPKERLIVGMY